MSPSSSLSRELPAAAASSFVGRERELVALRTALDEVVAGHGRVFLLVGEPGIGKTRLASEIGSEAARRGARVLWGRCSDDSGVPPFWPWAQVLRRLSEGESEECIASELLGHIVPELGRGSGQPGEASQPAEQRFELFDAVERRFRAAAAAQPLVLILDDLHAADLSSLQLLQFMARQGHDTRLLIIASYRAADSARVSERAQILNQISRNGSRLPLSALSEAQVGELVRKAWGSTVPAALAASVFRMSEGNPLFVGEVVSLLLSERDARGALPSAAPALRIPHGVREIIRERLQPLSANCVRCLSAASVLGRAFDATLLRSLCRDTATVQNDCLAEAEGAGIVEALDPGTAQFQFSHDLIREALYGALPAAERVQLHHRAAELLETTSAPVAEVAYHFARGALPADAEKAVDYLARAAEQAVQQWAYEEAEQHYAEALRVLALAAPAATGRRGDLLLAQGRAQRATGRPLARATFEAAAELARRNLDDDAARGTVLLSEAALGVADQGLGLLQLSPDAAAVQLLEEALQTLPPGQARLRLRLLARLAAHLSFPGGETRSMALLSEAEEQARALADEAGLAMVLDQQHLVWWRFNRIPGRIEIASELIELAERLGDHALAWRGRSWRVVDRMTVGEVEGIDVDLRSISERAEAIRQPHYRWMAANLRTTRAMWSGQWSEAEEVAMSSLQLGGELGDPMASVGAAFQLFLIRRELGQVVDEGQLRFVTSQYPDSPMPRALLMSLLLDEGRVSEAQAELDHLAVGEFAMVSHDRRLGILALLAETCTQLEDVARARILIELLAPFAQYNVMYAGNACFGAAVRYLGTLAALCGDWEQATAWLEQALERNQRMGAWAQLAWTQHDFAWALLRRAIGASATSDLTRARQLLAEARTRAVALSMLRLQRALDGLQGKLDVTLESATTPVPQPERGAGKLRGVFRRDGEYWSVGDGQELVRVKDTKGLQYIAELLRRPGLELYALDLVSLPGSGRERDQASQLYDEAGAGVGETLLDAPARAAYRQRLTELRGEIDEVTRLNDLGSLERLHAEEEHLKRELARALGLRGRSRPTGSPAERARLNVTRAIKTAIRKISEASPKLGHLFATTIKTGNVCGYAPDPRAPLEWAL